MTATATGLQLRDYQREAIDAVFAKRDTVRRQLIAMATGLGKTATAVSFAWQWRELVQTMLNNGARILWLTHRDELVQQTLAAFDLWWPESALDIGIVKAESDQTDKPIVVASIQTLAVEKRRERLLADQLAYGRFGLVISDEHHHSVSPTWAATLDALGCGDVDGPLMLGLTATPKRADGVGLKATTDEIVFERDTVWAIANNYLVPPKGVAVDVDLSSVKVSGGDYQAGSLGDVLEADGAHALIAEVIQRYAPTRKTIVFTPTVAFARLVADECVNAGFAAEMVSGETPLDERRGIYARLRSGETKIIVNCMVLTEGFDEPSVDCIVVARPTRSETLFIQMVGRGLRLYPEKEDCVVICLAGTERHKLCSLATLAGRRWEDAVKARELAAEQGELFDFAAEFDMAVQEDAKRAGMKAREIDLLGKVRRKITWARIDEFCFAQFIPHEDPADKTARRIVVFKANETNDGTWRVVGLKPRDGTFNYRHMELANGVDFATAQGIAENTVRDRTSGSGASLINPNARWRSQPASDKQKELLMKYKIPFIDGVITSGMASDALDVRFLAREAKAA